MMETIPLPKWRLRNFSTGHELFRKLAHHARPPEKLTVTEFAIKHQGYDPDYLPWQPEIMDALGNPAGQEVGLCGPVQTGKSTIGLAWAGWIIACQPDEMLIGHPTQDLARTFVNTRLDPMIEKTRIVASRLMPFMNANATWLKQFMGMNLATVWPAPAQFAQRPIRYGWLDDYDQFAEDIGSTAEKGGQGSALALLEGRLTSYEGRSKKFISSTLADDGGGKTEAFVAGGTDERLQPVCPSCGERWEIDLLADLKFDASGSPDHAASTAHVVCGTGNGCVLEPKDKRRVLRGLIGLPNRGFVAANEAGSKGRRTFRIDGLLCMTSWTKLAHDWRAAQIEWEKRQDETHLRTFVQTKAGKNYRSRLSGEKPLGDDDIAVLKDKDFREGIIPAGPVTWTLAVDVQGDRFECAAVGYADGHESWLIKRWSIDVLEDGLTTLQPFRKPEHWRMLLPLFHKTWKLANGGESPPPLCVAIDTGGGGDKEEATATENAKKFWRMAVSAGVHRNRIMLLKGRSDPKAELVKIGQFSDRKVKGTPQRAGPVLWLVNVHKIKNIMDARLRRRDPGPGRVHLPKNFEEQHLQELTAEELVRGKWKKVRARNETWDLVIYAWAALIKPPFAKSRDDMGWVPKLFRIGAVASRMVTKQPVEQVEDQEQIAMPARRASINKLTGRKRGDWLKGNH